MIRQYDKSQLPDYDDEIDDDPDLGDPFMDDEPEEPDVDWNSPYRGIEEARRHLEEAEDDDAYGVGEEEANRKKGTSSK